MEDHVDEDKKKAHRERRAGRKADKKNSRIHTSKKWMRKAFAIQSLAKARKHFHRARK
ncbi:hypothetical protein DAPPUDRAFT_248682 [Daphnia pulex]|uniref:Uncharacterized protein n=1 Tax=Daphnia pulex TaxID=6669 RepID=E9GV04_DAPPU|nr:hypothetical protein DAPPUDRAFT_248682 [Daphnia pulex]|eukprot:EFX76582.1 hypothetical protein DAPPUDRAFT_248682 [Daphnia pulex]